MGDVQPVAAVGSAIGRAVEFVALLFGDALSTIDRALWTLSIALAVGLIAAWCFNRRPLKPITPPRGVFPSP
jgi:ABC-type Mn2+/Zn2+ transport system permease subunit